LWADGKRKATHLQNIQKREKINPLFCLFAQEAAIRLPKGLFFPENPAELGVFPGGGH
jgi:hypothetical protein